MDVWRVVEREPGRWFCELMPSQWFGRFDGSPVRLVGCLEEALGLALHCAGLAGLDRVTVWPMYARPYPVMVSGDVPATVPGVLRASGVEDVRFEEGPPVRRQGAGEGSAHGSWQAQGGDVPGGLRSGDAGGARQAGASEQRRGAGAPSELR